MVLINSSLFLSLPSSLSPPFFLRMCAYKEKEKVTMAKPQIKGSPF